MTNGILVHYIIFFLYSNHHTIWYLTWPVMCLYQQCYKYKLAFRSRIICPIVFHIYSVVNTLRGVKIPNSNRGDNNACAKNIPWVFIIIIFRFDVIILFLRPLL